MPASTGDTVRVHYRGTLENGEEFDSSEGREPLEFTLGEGCVIPGFEEGVLGLEEGESRTVSIAPEDAYGPRNEELVHNVEADAFAGEAPYVGAAVQLVAPDGSLLDATISEVRGDEVVLDFNHPLAGKTLKFDIQLVENLGPDGSAAEEQSAESRESKA